MSTSAIGPKTFTAPTDIPQEQPAGETIQGGGSLPPETQSANNGGAMLSAAGRFKEPKQFGRRGPVAEKAVAEQKVKAGMNALLADMIAHPEKYQRV